MAVKPSDAEEEYFARKAYEQKRQIEEENHKKMKAAEKEKLKKLHHMHCPKCGMELIEIDYKNIKIDKCSECHGIWLDAGELETVTTMEKSFLKKFLSVFGD